MAVKYKEKCKKCFHFQVCAKVLQNDLFIREVMLGEKEPECKQFVEVVRCKDCKYINREIYAKGYGCLCDAHSCNRKGHERYLYVDDDDFCSRGERREGE